MLFNYVSAWFARFNAPPVEPPHSPEESLVDEAELLAGDVAVLDEELEAEPGSTGAALGISAGFYT